MRTAGLLDLQVNGYAGVDFNDAALTPDALDQALHAMLRAGVTHCLPTLITASEAELTARLGALDRAIRTSRLGPVMALGIHLEGPFLNSSAGYAGCHPPAVMVAPDPALLERMTAGVGTTIRLLTLAPELPGALSLITWAAQRGIVTAMGHTAVDHDNVMAAAAAGISLSTHLGNALPQPQPKFLNPLVAQLAEDRLCASFIADGVHIPPHALGVLLRAKGLERCILVTDATAAADTPPGIYEFAGMRIEHAADGSVREPGSEVLAGSALRLDQAVRNVVSWGFATVEQAIAMASVHPARLLGIERAPSMVEWDAASRPRSATVGGVTVTDRGTMTDSLAGAYIWNCTRRGLVSIGVLAAATIAPRLTLAQSSTAQAGDTAGAIAVQGVVYGLPLVLMDMTRQTKTNVTRPDALHAPINQFAHATEYHDATFKDVVRSNVDSLYSVAWLDLEREPVILGVPDTNGRFYLFQMLDMWTNVFASPGTRTTGSGPGNFAVAGPDWSGTLPAGVRMLRSPTNLVWVIGPTQTNGPSDYAAVHVIQQQYKLTPLSSFGRPYTPPEGTFDPAVDMKTPPVQQIAHLGGIAFFSRLAALLKTNPPPPADAPILARLARIGLVPGHDFDPSKLSDGERSQIEVSVSSALPRIMAAAKASAHPVNGWNIPPTILGNFGTNYAVRAEVALVGLAANLPADTIYPTAYTDAEGHALSGTKHYLLHFAKSQIPPANAFWSVTMYNSDSFFVPNAINRYALSSWMPLRYNTDGTLDLFIQKGSPGPSREANWLPAPDGDFNVTMRLYWPKPEALDGGWAPPGIVPVV